MKSGTSRVVATVAAAGVLVLGFDAVTYATTGNSLILGHHNSSDAMTTLTTTGSQAALRLTTRPDAPPLAVTSGARVDHLNAAMVGGFHSSALTTRTTVYTDRDSTTTHAGEAFWPLALGAGRYAVSYAAALAPFNESLVSEPNWALCGFIQGAPAARAPLTGVWGLDSTTVLNGVGVAGPEGSVAFLSGADTITIGAAANVTFVCEVGTGAFTLFPVQGIHVSVTKLNGGHHVAFPTTTPPTKARLFATK